MNVCAVSTFTCIFDVLEAKIKADLQAHGHAFVKEYELIKVSEHTSVFMAHANDFEAMGVLMNSPEMKQWDKENGCMDSGYMMEKMG